jgi:hypothetical protein
MDAKPMLILVFFTHLQSTTIVKLPMLRESLIDISVGLQRKIFL